ncbi:MAG: hypothetical protein C4321_02075 [Chloroflexota bacterium]
MTTVRRVRTIDLENPFVESFEGMVEILLIRHGEQQFFANIPLGQAYDAPLSELGQKQAQAVALRLAPARLGRVYTSDMRPRHRPRHRQPPPPPAHRPPRPPRNRPLAARTPRQRTPRPLHPRTARRHLPRSHPHPQTHRLPILRRRRSLQNPRLPRHRPNHRTIHRHARRCRLPWRRHQRHPRPRLRFTLRPPRSRPPHLYLRHARRRHPPRHPHHQRLLPRHAHPVLAFRPERMSRILEPSPTWFEIDPAFYAHGGICLSEDEHAAIGEAKGLRAIVGPVTPESRAEEALSLVNLGATVLAWAPDEPSASPGRHLATEAGIPLHWHIGPLETLAAHQPATFAS